MHILSLLFSVIAAREGVAKKSQLFNPFSSWNPFGLRTPSPAAEIEKAAIRRTAAANAAAAANGFGSPFTGYF
ncbi:hypothetical protein THOM_2725 [Trachipleistophora hominis]|uniref:Secreted protein n=1 Tax=Trachipleistophora hominis TaxID=72359 RepID=L7JUD6_TRAHO|nr:hypothetical protein THOM_2725 [Trachipleistophora hominis]